MDQNPWYPIMTPRLLLRPYHEGDLDSMQSYAADPEVTRYLPWGPNTPEITRQFLAEKIEEQSHWPRDEFTLAMVRTDGDELIGGIRIGARDQANRSADLGYVVHRNYWGQGYVAEAARALLGVAFNRLGMHRVWARCDVRNAGSWRVMEKLGMRREGEFQRELWQKGEWCSFYYYAILEDEWRSK